MNNIENMSFEDLEKITKNPGKNGLTLRQYLELLKTLETIKKETEKLEKQGFIQLTFWGKVKSLFSKKPVYVKKEVKK